MAGKVVINRKDPLKLPEAVGKKYEVVKGFPRISESSFGHVDLNRITLKRADELVKRGFGGLVTKKKSSNKE